ncbi:hypothetical protein RSOLAG22IIIB_10604 [Rhizoctonia solani]|uniref:CHAT domain-containing protein n=1 Tax=Rhizoctonia solani TaxID=456999 RepID=A0A0K6G483_9AGAM|nr:hypothetical protein RSOLAG22IIIB_10604 [Rhizoctonia solani]
MGVSHRNRFQRLGDLGDLEQAIQYESRALDLTPDDHPDLPRRLINLGVSHGDRFERLGELSDLEKAVGYQSRAVDSTPAGHPGLPSRLNLLGVSYNRRFQHLRNLDDLDKAIVCESRALALIPDDHPSLLSYLVNLRVSHTHRFHYLSEPSEVEEAIEYGSRVLALTPNGDSRRPRWLINLGASHSDRFQALGDLGDSEKAIDCISRAVELINENNPDICIVHFNLALFHMLHYEETDDTSHLQISLNSYRIASKSPVGAPRVRFDNAHRWATHASEYSDLNPIEAYQTTIHLLPHFIWFGATTAQRYEDLKTTATLAVDAATAAIDASDYSPAIEWLEHARCVVWNQSLMLRSPPGELEASHPVIATRLQTVAQQLHSASGESRESRVISAASMNPEQIGQQHRQLAKEYDQFLAQARAFPGFEDFLRPIKADRLVCAAKNGPVVLLNCHEDSCDALAILPQQSNVTHIPLPDFSLEIAQKTRSEIGASVGGQRSRERQVERRPLPYEGQTNEFASALAVLWNNVVEPILQSLGYMEQIPSGDLPHITWCPTGAMTFLPLHATGDYGQPRSRVFDYVVSSYTPTLTALLESSPYSLNHDSRVLAIEQTATPGHSTLPGTANELEKVTATSALDEMERHGRVHPACHAHQNVGHATQSAFFLHDGALDMASINRRSFKRKGLAFLSAYQTATGNAELPDESVHLASGMLMAGYTSVIATMWSVVDSDAPLVADEVYSQLMKDGKLSNGEAAKALTLLPCYVRESWKRSLGDEFLIFT